MSAGDGFRTGGLAATAVALTFAIAFQRQSLTPAMRPGDAAPPPAAVAAAPPVPVPMPAPPMPASVQVYDTASVLAAATPRVETLPTSAPHIEMPVPPAPRPRTEPRPARPASPPRETAVRPPVEPPKEQPITVAQASTSATVAAEAAPAPSFLVAPARVERTGGLRGGRYPALAVDFQAIGLDRYVRATEAAGGAFFAYLGARGIGPQVSLTDGRLVRTAKQSELAIERPYLVSDPAIQTRLEGLDLPEGASLTSVVMLWPRDLDARAWHAIEDALRTESIYSDQVAQIDARFGEAADRPEIQILGFTMLGEGGRRRLAQPRKVAVPSS